MEGRKFLDFLDMVDGGGAGGMGDKFEGGGLLSALANLGGSPYGSEDEKRRAAREAFYRSQNAGAPSASPRPMARPAQPVQRPMARPAAQSPMQMFGGQPPAAYTPPPPTAAQRFGNMPPAAYSPTPGPSINPANAYGPAFTFEDFVAGLGPVAQTASPEDLMTAYRQHMMGY